MRSACAAANEPGADAGGARGAGAGSVGGGGKARRPPHPRGQDRPGNGKDPPSPGSRRVGASGFLHTFHGDLHSPPPETADTGPPRRVGVFGVRRSSAVRLLVRASGRRNDRTRIVSGPRACVSDVGKISASPLDTRFLGPDHSGHVQFHSPPPPPQRTTHNAELNGRPRAGRSAASFLCSCAAVPGGVSILAASCGVKNAPGAPSACRDTDSPGLVRGAGIEPSTSRAWRIGRSAMCSPTRFPHGRRPDPQSRSAERRCDRQGAAGRGAARGDPKRTSETPYAA